VDFKFSEDSKEFRKQFRAWIHDNLLDEWKTSSSVTNENTAEIRRQWGEKLFEGGWIAPTWPKEYGGLGLSMEQELVYLEELVLARAPEELNSNVIGVFGPTLIRYGSDEQKNRYIPKILNHEEIWCQGFSEPNAGSDLAGLQTRAEKIGDKYLLNGQKIWTSFAQYADKCYVLVRTNPDAPKHEGISMMLLDMHQPGVTVRPLKNLVGTTEFTEVFLEDAIVPEHDVVGEINQGWEIANHSLANERGTRMAQRALKMRQEVKDLLHLYKELGIEDLPVEEGLIDSFIAAEVVRSVSVRNMMLLSEGNLPGFYPAMGKLTWSERHQKMLDLAFDMLGEKALIEGSPYSHWIHNLLYSRAGTIYAGTSEIQRNIIAKGLGLPSLRGGK
jgi:alkylation response protein AidB-like acyl-CoA dehydrogenase